MSDDGVTADCRCQCAGEDCLMEGQVCGSNGVTYSSYRELEVWKCQTQSPQGAVTVAYRGACQSESATFCLLEDCPKPSRTLHDMLSRTYQNLCDFLRLLTNLFKSCENCVGFDKFMFKIVDRISCDS